MTTIGLTTLASRFGQKETVDRLEAEIKALGMTVFARIDHAAGAAQVGMHLRPTELLIFGSAQGGTPLMRSEQSIGIDLPLRALAWEDGNGKAWFSYNDPTWFAKRHELGLDAQPAVQRLADILIALARKVAES